MYQTDMYEGMLAETITIPGANGDLINAYYARPMGPGPLPRHRCNSSHARLGRMVPGGNT